MNTLASEAIELRQLEAMVATRRAALHGAQQSLITVLRTRSAELKRLEADMNELMMDESWGEF